MSLSRKDLVEETTARTSERRDNNGAQPAGTCCCKLNVWSQPFNSRGAVIVLIWRFLIRSVFFFFNAGILIQNRSSGQALLIALLICIMFSYPLAGWLGEGHFGRYKVVSISLLVTWAAVIASGVSVLVDEYAWNDKTSWINYILFSVLYVVMNLGYVWLYTNLLPLGIDQLQGATSEQLRTYTYWYTWTQVTSGFVGGSVVTWLQAPVVVIVSVPAICLTLAVVMSFLLRDSLVKEPPTPHLLKNIYGILKFAIRNQPSRLRSALTYWEDEIPSRIDRAKIKYGGSYTTEEVENVKSLFRIAALALLMGVFVLIILPSTNELLHHFRHGIHMVSLQPLGKIPTVILIPFVELVLSPVKASCLQRFGILKRAGLGAALMLVGYLGIMALDVIGHEITNDAPCLVFANATSPKLNVDYRWLSLPWTLQGIGYFFLVTALFELIVAQAPYGMKSMLIGMVGITMYLPELPDVILKVIFRSVYSPDKATNPSCGLWIFLVRVVIFVTAFALLCIAIKKYRNRERDDTVRYHTFAENYYTV